MTRMRSPNFPGIPLDQAIKLVEVIFNKNRRNVIPRESASKDLGYSGLTGRSVLLLGALNQYDLIANKAKGQMVVTQTAVDILHGIEDEERFSALKKAGRSPKLFQSIFDRFPDGIPSENVVRSFLVQNGFTDKGVDAALSSFLATNQFLELNRVPESYSNEGQAHAESEHSTTIQDQNAVQEVSPPPPRTLFATNATVAAAGFASGIADLDYNLSKSGLAVTGVTNSKSALLEYIEKLKAIAVLLPDDEPKPTLDELLG